MSSEKKDRICKKFQEIFEILELEGDWKKTAMRLAEIYVEEIFPAPSKALSFQLYPQEGAKGQMILLNKVPIHTFCPHHLVLMIGHAEIAYIPATDAVLGFSKIHEIVDFLSKGPKLQEKLTREIGSTLSSILQTEDIAISTRLMHTCIAQKKKSVDSSTVESYFFSGIFQKESYQQLFFSRLSSR